MSYQRTRNDYLQELKEQLQILSADGLNYDKGLYPVAKSLATRVRVFVHDTKNSRSLLTQLERKSILFYSTPGQGSGAGWSHLTRLVIDGNGPRWMPFLETFPRTIDDASMFLKLAKENPGQDIQIPMIPIDWLKKSFEDWWNEAVLSTDQGQQLSRKQLVLSLADADGGAHVDPQLKDSDYAAFSRSNALGWQVTNFNTNVTNPMSGPQYACMRQIAYELKKSLCEQMADLL